MMTLEKPYIAETHEEDIKKIKDTFSILVARDKQMHAVQQKNYLENNALKKEVAALKKELSSKPEVSGVLFDSAIHTHKRALPFSKADWSLLREDVFKWKKITGKKKTMKQIITHLNEKHGLFQNKLTDGYLRIMIDDTDNKLIGLCH